jgi:ATP-dependent RNA helicase DDX56/DBP9
LTDKASVAESFVRAIVLAPTNELCKQIDKQISSLAYFCRDSLSVYCLVEELDTSTQFRLQRKPDIVISTPAKIAQNCRENHLDLSRTLFLVIDEADLVLSFGYSDDIGYITSRLPKIFQGMLVSATLSPQLQKFNKVILHNPLIIKIQEEEENSKLVQFYLETTSNDKFLILYVFLKLRLLQVSGQFCVVWF